MSGAIAPLPHYVFMAWCLVKAQGQLYLLPFPLLAFIIFYFRHKSIVTTLSHHNAQNLKSIIFYLFSLNIRLTEK